MTEPTTEAVASPGGHHQPPLVTEGEGTTPNKRVYSEGKVSRGEAQNMEAKSNILSWLLLLFLDPLMKLGYKRPLGHEDLYMLESQFSASTLAPKFDAAWATELNHPKGPSVIRALIAMGRVQPAPVILLATLVSLAPFAGPLVLSALIAWLDDPNGKLDYGVGLAVVLVVIPTIGTFISIQIARVFARLGVRWKAALNDAIYRKSLRLSNKARTLFDSGKIVQFMSSDANAIYEFTIMAAESIAIPVQIVIALILLCIELKAAIFGALFVILCFVPYNWRIAAKTGELQKMKLEMADSRVKLINELLNGIKVIKFNTYEDAFVAKVTEKREQELLTLHSMNKYQAMLFFGIILSPNLIFVGAIASYAAFYGTPSTTVMFVSFSLFNLLRIPLTNAPNLATRYFAFLASAKRIEFFLRAIEKEEATGSRGPIQAGVPVIEIVDGSFQWAKVSAESMGSMMGKAVDAKNKALDEATKNKKKKKKNNGKAAASIETEQQEEVLCEEKSHRRNERRSTARAVARHARRSSSYNYYSSESSSSYSDSNSSCSSLESSSEPFTALSRAGSQSLNFEITHVEEVEEQQESIVKKVAKTQAKSAATSAAKSAVKSAASGGGDGGTPTPASLLAAGKEAAKAGASSAAVGAAAATATAPGAGAGAAAAAAAGGGSGSGIGGKKGKASLFKSAAKTVAKTARKVAKEKGVGGGDGSLSGLGGIAAPRLMTLSGINLKVEAGQLVMIIGSVGSGKSSLLAAILGEIECVKGSATLYGSVAYMGQTVWIMNQTVKNNIIVGGAYDEARYQNIIDMCCLGPDLEVLPGGDATEIGERGINLSGGQKQRISMARAVYSNADVYLIDDPLSAVDAHVGQSIFKNVINGLLKGKTRIMTTNQLQYLTHADHVVYLSPDGTICEEGTLVKLLENDGPFAAMYRGHMGADSEQNKEPVPEAITIDNVVSKTFDFVGINKNSQAKKEGKDLIQVEDIAKGHVTSTTYFNYLKTLGGYVFFGMWLFIFVVSQGSRNVADLWMSWWSADEFNQKLGWYVGILFALNVGNAILVLIRELVFIPARFKSSKMIHSSLLQGVLSAPMEFFDTTPHGRVLNRFAKDIYVLDFGVPPSLNFALLVLFILIGIVVTVSIITWWFAIAVVAMAAPYMWLLSYYRKSSLQLKRLESVSSSPVYQHFTETIDSVDSIRAYKLTGFFTEALRTRVDGSNETVISTFLAQIWLQMRLNIIGGLLVGVVTFAIVFTKGTMEIGTGALAISYVLGLTKMLEFLIVTMTGLENVMTNVERLDEYKSLPSEAPRVIEQTQPPPSWPSLGAIRLDGVVMSYRKGLPSVLKGISASIKSCEKIGVVGRTGSGKSSLMTALFRLVELSSGTIFIDDVDISKIGLKILRENIAIIPQDPVMFSGTLQENIDPVGKYSSEAVEEAVDHALLRPTVNKMEGGLAALVGEGGGNLSVGERQLVCLARALLRHPKILILDEATASVDFDTDVAIQKTVRTAFANCTTLTIAHRLNTIMDADRILVLNDGHIAEFDTPAKLLENPTGIFSHLVDQTGPRASLHLRDIANGKVNFLNHLALVQVATAFSHDSLASMDELLERLNSADPFARSEEASTGEAMSRDKGKGKGKASKAENDSDGDGDGGDSKGGATLNEGKELLKGLMLPNISKFGTTLSPVATPGPSSKKSPLTHPSSNAPSQEITLAPDQETKRDDAKVLGRSGRSLVARVEAARELELKNSSLSGRGMAGRGGQRDSEFEDVADVEEEIHSSFSLSVSLESGDFE